MAKNKKSIKNKANKKVQNAQKLTNEEVPAETEVGGHSKGDSVEKSKELVLGEDVKQECSQNNEIENLKEKEEEETTQPSSQYKEVENLTPFTSSKSTYYSSNRKSEPYKSRERFHDERQEKRRSFGRNGPEKDVHSRRNDREKSEYRMFEGEYRRDPCTEYTRTTEIEQDLFLMPKDYSLAHCVAEDMNMGSGIAVRFRYEFKRVDELLNQQQKTGGLAMLRDNGRFIYYLVTKQYSTGKPTYATLFESLRNLRDHIKDNRVRKIAMPRIGCGLDRLEWEKVKYMIEFVFREVDVEITICNLQQVEESSPLRHKNCRLTNVTYPIQDIEQGTIIIYLSSENGFISEEMKLLDEKFQFLNEFRIARKIRGQVIYFTKNKDFLLCGCIVKQHETEFIDFVSLKNCLTNIQKENKEYRFDYVGFQAIKDDDLSMNNKIINILRNTLRNVEVYICWPGDLQNCLLTRDTPRNSLEKEKERRSFDNYSSNQRDWRKQPEDGSASYSTPKRSYSPLRRHESPSKVRPNLEGSWLEQNSSTAMEGGTERPPRRHESPCKVKPNSRDYWSLEGSRLEQNQSTAMRGGRERPSTSQLPDDDWDAQGSSKVGQKAKDRYVEKGNKQKKEWDESSEDEENWDLEYTGRNLASNNAKPDENSWNSKDEQLQSSKKPKNNKNTQRYRDVWIADEQLPSSKKPQNNKSTQRCRDVWIAADQPQIGNYDRDNDEQLQSSKKPQNNKSTQRYRDVWIAADHQPQIPPKEEQNNELKVPRSDRLIHLKAGLHQMKKKSLILYWASEDGHFSDEMNSLSRKFEFPEAFVKAQKRLGVVIKYKQNEDHVLYGCIVKKKYCDPIDFAAVRVCLTKVRVMNKVEMLPNVGIQAVRDDDNTVNFKIINALIDDLQDLTVNVCWPGDLKQKMPKK